MLTAIYADARRRRMAFVPVLRLSDAPSTRAQIAACTQSDGRGVAIRHRLLGSASINGRGAETLLIEALHTVDVEITGADLILDLDFISEDVDLEAEDVAATIDDLTAIGNWRSVVLVGSSMPSSLGGGVVNEGTIGRLPRREWDLWRDLAAMQISRLPTFGDYAIQNPKPPFEGQSSGPGQRANIRYTADQTTLVPRAVGAVIQEGAEQYRELCELLVSQPEFAGADFSWGDQEIFDCAYGLSEPGWQEQWRGAGTSHHLGHVVDQLSRIS
ncbi:hypothetical protein AWC31_16370 [Mycolicibacterium wolinskyi]|uniref:Uncharacterized protein n=1 Tax=Mycolicibacterium wolinskyi TaxID=59750 RepID=A0A1X2FJ23_9MYCO|nr:hypothetical protein AWC31_16370 [Mycolicibacterium wolinskyi]